MRRAGGPIAAAVVAVVLLAGCASVPAPDPRPTGSGRAVVSDVVTGLESPWSILRRDDGTILVSQRDDGRIMRVDGGEPRPIGTVPGVVHQGEAGLLGIAFRDGWLYAYETTADDNRVVRMRLGDGPSTGAGQRLVLGSPQVVLKGMRKAGNHNGGRIAFGPDGMLYVTVGDAGTTSDAQELDSLNGKILRMTPEGRVPADNPFPGSYVYSYGHRNPQGLAWDADGQLWASEFGQDTWDELNRIRPGADYGWPTVEGKAGDDRFVDPVAQWRTDDASPSGLAFLDGSLWMAGLGGERLWRITIGQDGRAASSVLLAGDDSRGRLRDVAPGPDGGLLVLTDNTDGRGTPRPGDDRLLRIGVPAS
ncbi:PQQ-dependent sugar dehydrogenase [Pseudolysinimonas sp.]|uniref:PQQ-dependent sugar dehydrogenase n=1 Tax=Pseudolysinimonas sp. TaxID=2680009 RepID=UPI003F7F487F